MAAGRIYENQVLKPEQIDKLLHALIKELEAREPSLRMDDEKRKELVIAIRNELTNNGKRPITAIELQHEPLQKQILLGVMCALVSGPADNMGHLQEQLKLFFDSKGLNYQEVLKMDPNGPQFKNMMNQFNPELQDIFKEHCQPIATMIKTFDLRPTPEAVGKKKDDLVNDAVQEAMINIFGLLNPSQTGSIPVPTRVALGNPLFPDLHADTSTESTAQIDVRNRADTQQDALGLNIMKLVSSIECGAELMMFQNLIYYNGMKPGMEPIHVHTPSEGR